MKIMVVFVELTGLLIPSFVAVILPITTFVVVQFVYQRLSGDRDCRLAVREATDLSFVPESARYLVLRDKRPDGAAQAPSRPL